MIHRIQRSMDGVLLLIACLLLFLVAAGKEETRIHEKLRPAVIRLHILADSDETEAQCQKLLVRDALLQEMSGLLKEAETKEEAEKILSERKEDICLIAKQTLADLGVDLPVQVELGESWFPTKEYGNVVLPAGEYDALRVLIGKAEGHNWWCMLFPGLCFADGTYRLTDEKSQALKSVLTEEEFQKIWCSEETDVKVQFWIWKKLEQFLK